MSRKRIGQPISLTLTPEQRTWVDAQVAPGGTRTEVIRRIIQEAMDFDKRHGDFLRSPEMNPKEALSYKFPLSTQTKPIILLGLVTNLGGCNER